MQRLATAGIAFLLAVCWFDLMFDVQVRGRHEFELPPEIRNSIASYYARVTIRAYPMNRLVATVMGVTVIALVVELFQDGVPFAVALASLILTLIGVGLAAARTVRNAQRLGAQHDDAGEQSALARQIYRDHVVCLVVISVALALQLLG